jgi:hypothetical protein
MGTLKVAARRKPAGNVARRAMMNRTSRPEVSAAQLWRLCRDSHCRCHTAAGIVCGAMQQVAVNNVVALTDSLIGEWSPNLKAFRDAGRLRTLEPVSACGDDNRAVEHVDRRTAAHARHRRQRLVQPRIQRDSLLEAVERLVQAEKVWETARKRAFDSRHQRSAMKQQPTANAGHVSPAPTCSGGTTCIRRSITPSRRDRSTRQMEGRFRIATAIRRNCAMILQKRFGRFPLFNFWGPMSSIKSSRWIADASMHVHENSTRRSC